MRRTCAACGDGFDAKRASAKTCSERCRKRVQRGGGVLIPLPEMDNTGERVDGPLAAATRKGLEGAERVDTELGTAALLLATRLDAVSAVETGAGVAALMKEYRATLAEALKDAERDADPLEEIRGSAALKLIHGTG